MNNEIENIFKDKFNFDENRYFYHISSEGTGKLICEEGLGMVDNYLFSTTIEITPEIIANPISFLESEYNFSSTFKREEMIIIGCNKENISDLVINNDSYLFTWSKDDQPSYIIPSENIMGYIDLKNLNFIENDNYILNDNYHYGV